MRVNLRGGFVTLRECARAMVARERPGAIVAVTSVSGFLTDRSMAHYSVSKAGLAALVRVAARELGPHGIRVNGVAPGTTDTPMFAATDQMRGYRERVAGRAALGRVGTAAEVAQAIVASVHARLGHRPDRRGRRRRVAREPDRPDGPEPGAIVNAGRRDTGRRLRLRRADTRHRAPDLHRVVRGVRGARRGPAHDRGVVGGDRNVRRHRHRGVACSNAPTGPSISTPCTSRGAGTTTRSWPSRSFGPASRPGSTRPTPRASRLAIASSSPADWVQPHLERLGLRDRFAYVVTADPPRRGKPHARHLSRSVRAARRRPASRAGGRGFAARHRGREGRRPALRHRCPTR